MRHAVRANPPLCSFCDLKLGCGGFEYTLVWDDHHGAYKPAHVACAAAGRSVVPLARSARYGRCVHRGGAEGLCNCAELEAMG